MRILIEERVHQAIESFYDAAILSIGYSKFRYR